MILWGYWLWVVGGEGVKGGSAATHYNEHTHACQRSDRPRSEAHCAYAVDLHSNLLSTHLFSYN